MRHTHFSRPAAMEKLFAGYVNERLEQYLRMLGEEKLANQYSE